MAGESFIQKAKDDYERRLEEELLRKFREMGLDALRQNLAAALTGDQFSAIQGIIDAMDWAQMVSDWAEVSRILAAGGKAGGNPTLNKIIREARRKAEAGLWPTPSEVMIDMAFDIVDRNVTRYAERRAAELVVQIADDMRNTIRTVIVEAVNGGYTADEAARVLAKVIPLHDRYARAVMRRERSLYERFIREGMTAGKARAKAAELGTKYAQKLTRARARTIARTEIMTASNYGQWEGYRNSIDSGFISNPAQGYKVITKEWITAQDERVCPVCGPMDEKQVDWSEEFKPGMPFPPAHPNCRCSWNIIDNFDQHDFDGAGTAEEEYSDLLRPVTVVQTTLEMPV